MRSSPVRRVAGALLLAALVGCAPYDVCGAEESLGDRTPYLGATAYSYRGLAPAHPPGHSGRQTAPHRAGRDHLGRHRLVQLDRRRPPAVGVRDWRAGDGEFRRQQRVYRGVGLEERHRRSRQERLHEERRDSADSARILRADRDAARHDDRAAATARERLRRLDSRESLLARQIERASQAERQAQRRAAEVRARLLAERRAAGEVPGAAPAISTGDAPSESGPF